MLYLRVTIQFLYGPLETRLRTSAASCQISPGGRAGKAGKKACTPNPAEQPKLQPQGSGSATVPSTATCVSVDGIWVVLVTDILQSLRSMAIDGKDPG